MTAGTKRVRAVVQGRVQGVGFRYFTRAKADHYGLSGWVRNQPDNTVEFEAQGESAAVESFLADMKKGPPLSHVSEITATEMPVEELEQGFEIRY
jgi:acylphosphatase